MDKRTNESKKRSKKKYKLEYIEMDRLIIFVIVRLNAFAYQIIYQLVIYNYGWYRKKKFWLLFGNRRMGKNCLDIDINIKEIFQMRCKQFLFFTFSHWTFNQFPFTKKWICIKKYLISSIKFWYFRQLKITLKLFFTHSGPILYSIKVAILGYWNL